jgi:hypothetical protein
VTRNVPRVYELDAFRHGYRARPLEC